MRRTNKAPCRILATMPAIWPQRCGSLASRSPWYAMPICVRCVRPLRLSASNYARGGVGLFYFAGHGVQVSGENYMLPLGMHIRREQDVPYEAVPVGRILGGME